MTDNKTYNKTYNKTDLCTIPVQCEMHKQPDGSFKMVNPVYKQIPASTIAEMLIRHYGVDAIYKGGDSD